MTIISDNGRQFDNQGFRDFCSNFGIRNQFSSPRHPQANGQAEVSNRTLLKIIKTKLDDAKGATQRPLGLPDHGKNPDWRNPLQTHIWHRSRDPGGGGSN